MVPQSGTMTKIFKTWQSVFKIQISNKLRESKSFGSLKKAIRTSFIMNHHYEDMMYNLDSTGYANSISSVSSGSHRCNITVVN